MIQWLIFSLLSRHQFFYQNLLIYMEDQKSKPKKSCRMNELLPHVLGVLKTSEFVVQPTPTTDRYFKTILKNGWPKQSSNTGHVTEVCQFQEYTERLRYKNRDFFLISEKGHLVWNVKVIQLNFFNIYTKAIVSILKLSLLLESKIKQYKL